MLPPFMAAILRRCANEIVYKSSAQSRMRPSWISSTQVPNSYKDLHLADNGQTGTYAD